MDDHLVGEGIILNAIQDRDRAYERYLASRHYLERMLISFGVPAEWRDAMLQRPKQRQRMLRS